MHRTSNCDRELQRQLDDERYERQRLEDQLRHERETAENARRERLQMYREQARQSARTASTWPEALHKQIALFAVEAYQDDDGDDIGVYFIRGKAACELALEIWSEEERAIAEQVADLQRQIDALRDGIRFAVANRLDEKMPDNEGIAVTIRETPETEEDLSEWLNW